MRRIRDGVRASPILVGVSDGLVSQWLGADTGYCHELVCVCVF